MTQYPKELETIWPARKWISYEPTELKPGDRNARQPSLEHMKRELKIVHGGGFDGLVTFSGFSEGFGESLLQAAHDAGFKKVIVGIHIDRPEQLGGQIHKPQDAMDRIAQFEKSNPDNIVVGYCLGHNTSYQVPLDQLWAWMDELRGLTGKPVTTTFNLSSYLGVRGERIRKTGDYYFPDIQAGWQQGCSPDLAIDRTRHAIDQIAELRDKPVLMKMVSYPSDGGPGLSEDNQAEFYTQLIRDTYLPPGCQLAIFSAYDLPYKSENMQNNGDAGTTQPTSQPAISPFARSEVHVGLITAPVYDKTTGMLEKEGNPKKAFGIVSSDLWPINKRP